MLTQIILLTPTANSIYCKQKQSGLKEPFIYVNAKTVALTLMTNFLGAIMVTSAQFCLK